MQGFHLVRLGIVILPVCEIRTSRSEGGCYPCDTDGIISDPVVVVRISDLKLILERSLDLYQELLKQHLPSDCGRKIVQRWCCDNVEQSDHNNSTTEEYFSRVELHSAEVS